MRILKADHHKRMAWKNGGGETIELAVHPPGADLSAFGWRVSMARVETDGPFSLFEGIDRTLSLLEGEGMVLEIEGAGARRLRTDSDPLRFAADAPTRARLLGGAILDLNVMTRRGAFDHRVHRLAIEKPHTIAPAARWTLILALGPVEAVEVDGTVHALGPHDALLLDGEDAPATLSSPLPRTAFLIEIDTPDLA